MGLSFFPAAVNADYFNWPLLPELFPVSFPGVKTSRDDVVVDIDRERLVRRMEQYFNPAISHDEMRRICPGVMENGTKFKAQATREYLCKRGFLPDKIIRYCYRPFDVRWLYWEPEASLLDRGRAEYVPHVFEGNLWLSAGQRNRKEDFYQPQFTTLLADHHIVESNVAMFPLYLRPDANRSSLFEIADDKKVTPNLSDAVSAYLAHLNVAVQDFFYHALAILHAPAYRAENAGALRQDWPRVPLPDSKDALTASAALGRQIAALLDTEKPVVGVTTGIIRPELRPLAVISHAAGGSLNPDADLRVTAGWGHAGKEGVTMPGKGKITSRDYTTPERDAPRQGAETLGLSPEQVIAQLGETTCDIYLNDVAYWKNAPARVWGYTIGGYQGIKKWLSYREAGLLGRSLTADEAREVMGMARRVAAIRLLEPGLDANYRAVKQATFSWRAE